MANDGWLAYTDIWRCDHGVSTITCPIQAGPAGYPVAFILNDNPSSPYYGDCLGDLGNSSTDAAAGTNDKCDNNGPNGGWGTVFLITPCGNGSYMYWNGHWSPSWTLARGIQVSGTGNQAYLNSASLSCLFNTQY